MPPLCLKLLLNLGRSHAPYDCLACTMNKFCCFVSRSEVCPLSTWWCGPTQQVQRTDVRRHTRGQWRVNSGTAPTMSWNCCSPLTSSRRRPERGTVSLGCQRNLRVLAAIVGAGRSLGVCISCEDSSFKTSVARLPATHIAFSFDPYAAQPAARHCLRCWRLLI